MEKTAVILINLGTPETPNRKSVKRFLSEFLNDPFVIDLPYLARKILVNCIIVPFRAGKSANMYKKIWTKKGSPIMIHSMALLDKLKQEENHQQNFYLAMRYGNPSITQIFSIIQTQGNSEILVIPLFPQYASSTTGSVIQKCNEITSKWNNLPQVKYLDFFYNHKSFIDVWVKRLNIANYKTFSHILFVFHGIPLRQAEKCHQGRTCEELECKIQISDKNNMCYQAQCYNNARILSTALELDESGYTVCFQSRFGKNWLNPFADEIIIEKARAGIKSLLVVPLSFVADCLETKLEIELEYAELFKSFGGENLTMVESLNSGDDWTDALLKIINFGNFDNRIT